LAISAAVLPLNLSGSAGSATLNVGDILRLEVKDTSIYAYRNGVLDTGVGSAGTGDATAYTSGVAGITGYNNGLTAGDLWTAGNL